ncbi:major facilitator superfamily domain-containing protein [Plectosphaerella plurivora]|uniref:Major facilitator superfamily domain-containing protein n=1 Tax=Plectosphaerella plurivora TaxID=936078 RepID=A0A9P9A5E6_9PEZI|nr:major facilitator superfamily domain-containing protein [Plectosphaerella plurivora]
MSNPAAAIEDREYEVQRGSQDKPGINQKEFGTEQHVEHDPAEVEKILRKIDWRLLPPLTLLYILAFIDRANIGNASIAGMTKDLKLTGPQYNMALTVFFFPYAFFEVPSNIVLKLMRPSWWITILVMSWGTVVTLQGLVQTYEHLIITRVLLGVTEAGFFPAATYLLTTWYCRWELQTRLAIFFSAASLAGSFSGLLAFGIEHMDGVGGLAGWRWIFILEGILTVVVGAFMPWALPNSPTTASFLTAAEKQLVSSRLLQDMGSGTGDKEKFQWKYLFAALTDWKIYLAVIIYWGNSISVYGFSFAAPTIIRGLGYSSAQAQLLTIPIYFVGACSTVIFARLSDRRRNRWIFIVIPFSIALVGFIAVLAIPHPRLPGLTYFFLFFITSGLYPSIIGCISWVGNNLAPSFKRAIGMALLISIGNLGGAVGSNIFLREQAPNYWLGYGFSAGVIVSAITATIILQFATKRINKKRDLIPEDEIRARYTEDELQQMGDSSPLFRYVS